MKRNHILLLVVAITAVVALTGLIPVALGVQTSIAGGYALALQLVSLFVGFLLAIRVSTIYNKELKRSFIFLSLFLLFYMISSPLILWEYIVNVLGSQATILLLLAFQALTYAMLITSCVYTVKVIEVRRMKVFGWTIFGIVMAFGVFIIVEGLLSIVPSIPQDAVGAISNIFIRFFDMAIIMMLVPVFILYAAAYAIESPGEHYVHHDLDWPGHYYTVIIYRRADYRAVHRRYCRPVLPERFGT